MRRCLLAAVALAAASLLLPAASGLSAASAPGAAGRRAPAFLNGVDISEWQATIDWSRVGRTATRFVIMRATRAHDYDDPMYGANLAGATDEGIVVGSYHRATPSGRPGDAHREAEHFLDVARNAAGDLLPVLDIEETGGLSPTELNGWVRRWVERVRDRLGVRPMLYASPYFWRVRMGDTTWFAERGYPLWIAHWGVTDPDVPASNWDGNGYLVHQWTSSGHVDGIPTRVDRDRYPGATLRTGRIAEVRVTAAQAGRIDGSGLSCGRGDTRCDRLVTPGDDLTLTARPAQGAVLLGWKGACTGAGTSPTCTVTAFGTKKVSAVFGYELDVAVSGTGGGSVSSAPAGIGCTDACAHVFPAGADVTLTASPDSASGFVGWSGGGCGGTAPTCTVTMDGRRNVTARFDATTELDQDGPGTSYRWGRRRDPRAVGGSYVLERRAGAEASFAFDGDQVRLDTIRGPSSGRARILVDGVGVRTIDGYASTFRRAWVRLDGLGAGPHVLTVRVLGTARPASDGTSVGIDAIRAGGQVRPNPAPAPATWASSSAAVATGGAFVMSDVAGAEARLAFTGTGVTLLTKRGPSIGLAELWVDGRHVVTWDLSAPAAGFVRRTVTGLADEDHVVRLVVMGRSGAHGSGRAVVVDGWVIR